jgi:hypothetical protein
MPTIAWSHKSITQGQISERLRKEITPLGSTLEFHELGESRQLAAGYPMCEVVKHLLDRGLITSHGHVKGTGLSKKSSAHCEFFSVREKAHEHAKVLSTTSKTK